MPDINTVLTGEAVTLRRTMIAKWLGNGTYSTNVQLYGSTNVTVTLDTIGDQRVGDGAKVLASYRRLTGATISLQWSGDLSTLGVMLGITPTTTGITPERIRAFRVSPKGTPYFGITGSIDSDVGETNAVHFFAPKCQLNADTIEILNISGGTDVAFPTVTAELTVLTDNSYIKGAVNEKHYFALGSPSAGTYTLSLGSSTTTALAFGASAATIQAALVALPVIGTGNATVVVSGSGFNIEYIGRLANSHFALVTGAGAGGFNGTFSASYAVVGVEGDGLIVGVYELEGQYTPALPPPYIV